MRILITGSAGFIGYHLIKKLFSESSGNLEIIGLDNINNYYSVALKKERLAAINRKKEQKNINYSFFNADISNFSELEKVFDKYSFDLVINLAAQPGVRLHYSLNEKYFDSNIQGFFNLVQCCKNFNVTKLVYASSSSVYGNSKNKILTENDNLSKQKSFYAISKLMNERMAEFYSSNLGIKAIGLRFFTVYGSYGRPDMAYYLFSKQILNKEKLTLFNSGKMARDMTHVSDVVSGIYASISYIQHMKTKHEIFNLGNDKPIKTINLLTLLEEKIGKKAIIEFKQSEMESFSTHACLNKSRKILRYKPKIDINEGLDEFIDWIKFNDKNKNF
tara:strand:- start:1379 stop:2374 length:996 start_codon:yes stop_codon:yes gene_type:complete